MTSPISKRVGQERPLQGIQKNSAITLIALIITIIVLLILAGVTLNMVMGDSGIFRKANWASFTTEYSKVQELSDIYAMSQKLQDYGSKTKIALTNGTGTKGKSYSEYYAKKGNQITPTGSLQKTIETMDNIDEAQIYELDLKAINADTKNGYVINITTGRVYRNKGFKFEGNTYHVPELPLLGNGDEPTPEIAEKVTEDYHFVTTQNASAQVELGITLPDELQGAIVTVEAPTSDKAVIEGSYNNGIYTGTIKSNENNNPNGNYMYTVKATKNGKEYVAYKNITINKFLNSSFETEVENIKTNEFTINIKSDYPEEANVEFEYYIGSNKYSNNTITGLDSSTMYNVKIRAKISDTEYTEKEIQVTTKEIIYKIYIDSENGNDTSGDGSEESPYKTLDKISASGIIQKGASYKIILKDGTYNLTENIFTLDCNKSINIIGNRQNTVLTANPPPFANRCGGSSNYSVNIYRLIWSGFDFRDYANQIFVVNNMNLYNVAFRSENGTGYAHNYFIPAGNLTLNNCTLSVLIGGFLRTDCGSIKLTNCYGGFSSGGNTEDSSWDYQTNYITTTPHVDESTYRITSDESESNWKNCGTGTDRDGTTADLGVYGGEYSWEYETTDLD